MILRPLCTDQMNISVFSCYTSLCENMIGRMVHGKQRGPPQTPELWYCNDVLLTVTNCKK